MQSKHVSLLFFLLVAGAHAGILAAVVLWPSPPKPVEIIQPTIQGMLIAAEPEPTPPPPEPLPPPPPPEKKPEPKPKPKPPPKAPPSERAVKAPEPEPQPQVQQPVETKPAEPAPAAPVAPQITDATPLNNPAPIYPRLSEDRCEQGTVLLDVLVKADGTVGGVKITTSSGFKLLDQAAQKAVARWRFKPTTQDGIAIDDWYEIPVEFSARKRKCK